MPFPATDFNFVVAGIATFAATVGYAYTRRFSASSTPTSQLTSIRQQATTESETETNMNESAMDIDHDSNDGTSPSVRATVKAKATAAHEPAISTSSAIGYQISMPSNLVSPTARRESLKRKVPHDGFDEPDAREPLGYPHNLANIYPRKRSKTPSSLSLESDRESQSSAGLPPSPTTSTVATPVGQEAKRVVDVEELHSMPIFSPCSTLPSGTNAATPATEPPLSPSPIPDVEGEFPAEVLAPLISHPAKSTSPSRQENREISVIQNRIDEAVASIEPVQVTAENSATPPPVDAGSKLATHPAFGVTSAPRPFSPSRPSTPSGTNAQPASTTLAPNPFAAFSGSTSPFASSSPFSRGSSFTSSPFGSTSTFGSSSFTSSVSSVAGAFGHAGSINNKNMFSVTPVWKLKPGSVSKTIPSQEAASSSALASDQKNEGGEGPDNEDDDRNEKSAEIRLARERREREEAEVRAQEALEKKMRKERRTRERAAGHVLLEASIPAEATEEKYTPLTGEEDEDVELEQRNIRLFVKRGERPYSEAIPGHIKLLANRRTLEERILVRREPLWKVSMNVRVQPTVRATFVTSEHGDHVLRFIVKEPVQTEAEGTLSAPVEGADATPKYELIIYVVKPGKKCPKQDFQEFAESLVETINASATSKTKES